MAPVMKFVFGLLTLVTIGMIIGWTREFLLLGFFWAILSLKDFGLRSNTSGEGVDDQGSGWLEVKKKHRKLCKISAKSCAGGFSSWVPQDGLPAPITYAAYSCNNQLIYATFSDGNIGVFDADILRLRCRIASSVYLSQAVLSGSQSVHPLVVAAHPVEVNQLVVGLTDGSVKVLEPKESERKWGSPPPADNGW